MDKRFPVLAQGVAILSIHVAVLEMTVDFIILWLIHMNILLRVFLICSRCMTLDNDVSVTDWSR
jgi:hypothetical protein